MLSYTETISALESRGIMPDRPPGLETTIEGLKRIGFRAGFPLASKTIVVAGTNGKGSVSATLEAIFRGAGERVGLYTSPHLVDYTERMRIAGEDVSRELFTRAYARVASETEDLRLSHFEMLTLMAVWLMASGELTTRVDRLILEVGLGGLWDATNAIPHTTSVIAALGLDHQNLLGPTIVDIARNKLGIVRPNTLVVHAPFPAECEHLVREIQSRLGGRWVPAIASRYRLENAAERPRYFIEIEGKDAEIMLAGARGAENTALALTVGRELGLEPSAMLATLKSVRWPGRMSEGGKAPSGARVYFSGDHNPQGIASLLELLPHYRRHKLHVVVGVGQDKDRDGVLAPLFALPDCAIYLTETPFRGCPLDAYGLWRDRAIGAWSDPREAFAAALAKAGRDDLVLVTGSLYLVGALSAQWNLLISRESCSSQPAR